MVLLGSVRLTVAVCDCLRPLLQAENGRKLAAEIGVPFKSTASVLVSTVHAASRRTLTLVTVTVELFAGVGFTNTRFPGFGKDHAARGYKSSETTRTPARTAPRLVTAMRSLLEGAHCPGAYPICCLSRVQGSSVNAGWRDRRGCARSRTTPFRRRGAASRR